MRQKMYFFIRWQKTGPTSIVVEIMYVVHTPSTDRTIFRAEANEQKSHLSVISERSGFALLEHPKSDDVAKYS